MLLEKLREEVFVANILLVKYNLVTLTWGNASGIDREKGLLVIKPSGVSYDDLTADQLVITDLDGKVVEGKFRPSSDTLTHVALYRAWPDIGGVVHTHSSHATMFSQACRPVPCFGTTHADSFYGEVPLVRPLTAREVDEGYEANTGKAIIERFAGIRPVEVPGTVVSFHGPFAWGKNAIDAAQNALILEEVAKMAMGTMQINSQAEKLPAHILEKHHQRKHGPNAYYGQK